MKKFAFVAALAVCAVTLLSLAPAQDMSKKILPTMRLQMAPAVERTPEQMDAADAAAVAPAARVVPFRPTMDAAQYAQLKAGGARSPRAAPPRGACALRTPSAVVH